MESVFWVKITVSWGKNLSLILEGIYDWTAHPPASLPPIVITLNARHFNQIYKTGSLKILRTLPPTIWKPCRPADPQWLGSQVWQHNWLTSAFPGKGTAPVCQREVSRAGSVTETRMSHSQWAQTGALRSGKVDVKPANPVRLRNGKAGLGRSCSTA